MIQRTKQITSAKTRQVEYFFVNREQSENEPKQEQPFNLKTHSLRYEEIIRKNKEEMRKKRNLEQIQEDQGREGGSLASEEFLPVGPSNAVSFKSHLHQEVRLQQKNQKDAAFRDLSAKIKMADRAKNYAKNVKEMYMPRIASNKYLQNPLERAILPQRGLSGQSGNFDGPRNANYNADNNISVLKPPKPIKYRPNFDMTQLDHDSQRNSSYPNTESALTGDY